MADLLFITHPEVIVDPAIPVERWSLSEHGAARMKAFTASVVPASVGSIWARTETKATEAAAILAEALGLSVRINAELGENDRSATGFLPPAEFETLADRFFAEPETSARGWERAVDAQARIREAIEQIITGHQAGDLAIVAHGAVGTLLYCALTGLPIDRAYDQPFQGHYWRASLPALELAHGWRAIG